MIDTKSRKSRRIGIAILGATATVMMGLASGCSDDGAATTAHCVDAQGILVPESQCSQTTGYSGYYGGHHWVYGGYASNGRVSGYSTSAPESGDISTDDGHVMRGGFGGEGDYGGHGDGDAGGGHGGGE